MLIKKEAVLNASQPVLKLFPNSEHEAGPMDTEEEGSPATYSVALTCICTTKDQTFMHTGHNVRHVSKINSKAMTTPIPDIVRVRRSQTPMCFLTQSEFAQLKPRTENENQVQYAQTCRVQPSEVTFPPLPQLSRCIFVSVACPTAQVTISSSALRSSKHVEATHAQSAFLFGRAGRRNGPARSSACLQLLGAAQWR